MSDTIFALRNHDGMSRREDPRMHPETSLVIAMETRQGRHESEMFDLTVNGCRVPAIEGLRHGDPMTLTIPGVRLPQQALVDRIDEDALYLCFAGGPDERSVLNDYVAARADASSPPQKVA